MRILHTSDWHVGKRLMGRERLQEQAEVLDEIVEICEREQIELVLIAGDIFDTYTPSAEAEELFYAKIKKWRERAARYFSSAGITTTAFAFRQSRRFPKNKAFT